MSSTELINSYSQPDPAIDKIMAWDGIKDRTMACHPLGEELFRWLGKVINLCSSCNSMSLWLDSNDAISNHGLGIIYYRLGTEVSGFHILVPFPITVKSKHLYYVGQLNKYNLNPL